MSQQTDATTLLRANALHAERREADRRCMSQQTDATTLLRANALHAERREADRRCMSQQTDATPERGHVTCLS